MFKFLIYLLLLWEMTRFLEVLSFFDFLFFSSRTSRLQGRM